MKRARSTMIRAPSSNAEHAGDASRGDFADAVADDRRRARCPTISTAPRATPASQKSPAGAISVRCICEVSSVRASSSSREKRAHGCIAAAQRSRVSRKTGSCRISSRPMPHHCGPWPLITKATRGARFAARSEGGADLRALLLHAEAVEFLHQLGHRTRDDGEPIRVVIAPRAERIDEIGQHRGIAIGVRTFLEPLRELQRGAAQRFLGARGEHDRPGAFGGRFGMLAVRAWPALPRE